MRQIDLTAGRMYAMIAPDFGGAVLQLSIDGKNVLRMDKGKLGMANVLAGGIPVLFPFVSKSRNDEIKFGDVCCSMPMHGFVKDMPFEILRVWENGCELQMSSNQMTKRYYPFDFVLTLVYEIEEQCLKTTMRVRNDSNAVLPFAAGFHPFFLATDRTQTEFHFGLKECWDYLECDAQGNPRHGILEHDLCLSDEHDAVFWNGNADCEMIDRAHGYRVRLICAKDFPVITICTTLENAACIEPWQARPCAIERPGECQSIKPGEERAYSYSIFVDTI